MAPVAVATERQAHHGSIRISGVGGTDGGGTDGDLVGSGAGHSRDPDGPQLPLRKTEGLLASVLTLMDLTISAPDHTTVSRRAVTLPMNQLASVPHGPLHVLIDSTGLRVYGAGQWLEAKHGAKSRRKWRKLRLAVDASSGMIVAQTLTDQDADDPSQVAPRSIRLTAGLSG
jgi:hypothetical protein